MGQKEGKDHEKDTQHPAHSGVSYGNRRLRRDSGRGNGNDTSNAGDVTTAAPEESTDPRYAIKENLPDKNYDDYSIRILMRNSTSPDWIGDMFSDDLTGEVIGDAIYKRNASVSECFGVEFKLIKSSNNNYETDGVNITSPPTFHGSTTPRNGMDSGQ